MPLCLILTTGMNMSKTLDLQEATYIEVWAEAKKYGVKTGQRNRKAVEADLQLILNDLKSKVSGGAWIVYPDGFKRGHPKKKTAWAACCEQVRVGQGILQGHGDTVKRCHVLTRGKGLIRPTGCDKRPPPSDLHNSVESWVHFLDAF